MENKVQQTFPNKNWNPAPKNKAKKPYSKEGNDEASHLGMASCSPGIT